MNKKHIADQFEFNFMNNLKPIYIQMEFDFVKTCFNQRI